MLLAEELVLLLLHDDTGAWLVHRHAVPRAVRVALLVELLAVQALSLDEDDVLRSAYPAATGGDPLLDRTFARVVGRRATDRRGPARGELRAVLHRLHGAGILRRSRLRPTRHLPGDAHPEAAVRERLRRALATDSRPDPRTALLAAMAHEMGLLPYLYDEETSELRTRAAELIEQLRADRRYIATTLAEDVTGSGRSRTGDVLEGIDDAVDLIDLVAVTGRVVGHGARAGLRALDGLDVFGW